VSILIGVLIIGGSLLLPYAIALLAGTFVTRSLKGEVTIITWVILAFIAMVFLMAYLSTVKKQGPQKEDEVLEDK
jgi:membrane protein implicated in regulation of membrane protease activity